MGSEMCIRDRGVGEVPFTRSAKHLELQLPKTPDTLLPLCFELEIG